MEHTSARLLRAAAEELPGCLPALTPREDELHHRLTTAATVLMARFGFAHISLAEFILALRVTKNAFRRLFCDMEGLCGEILIRHLTELLTFVTHAAQDSPGRRGAYLASMPCCSACAIPGARTDPWMGSKHDPRTFKDNIRLRLPTLQSIYFIYNR